MKNFVIREDQLIAVINYLANKPYVEVTSYIEMLQKVPEINVENFISKTPNLDYDDSE